MLHALIVVVCLSYSYNRKVQLNNFGIVVKHKLFSRNVHSVSIHSTISSSSSSDENLRQVGPTRLQQILQQVYKFEDDKEKSRKFRRTVFDKNDWKKHRSVKRYFKELMSMPRSFILRGLANQAIIIASVSAAITSYNFFVELNQWRWPQLPLLSLPSLPFSLTSPSLGLLLVFRTNAAYSRWKDARISWASISAKAFDLMRQASTWIEDRPIKAAVIRHTIAFTYCLKWSLGHRDNYRRLVEDLMGVLTDDEIEVLVESKSPVQWSLLQITRLIYAAKLIPSVQSSIDKTVIELTKEMEVCNRIYTTPIPLIYTRHTVRFLLLFLVTVPMGIYREFPKSTKWVVPIISFMQSIFLLGIEDLGVQIEEPFSILPLATICNNLKSTAEFILQDTVRSQNVTQPVVNNVLVLPGVGLSVVENTPTVEEHIDNSIDTSRVNGTAAIITNASSPNSTMAHSTGIDEAPLQ